MAKTKKIIDWRKGKDKLKQNQFSSFWLDKNANFKGVRANGTSVETIMAYAGHKKAISNFVSILTGKNIPVVYNSGNDSYTDGNRVVIAADLKSGNFDPSVGLALHEASHCLLTDFDGMKVRYANYDAQKKPLIHFLTNWIEDRRIDRWVCTEAPGYRGYYTALYDKYFFDDSIDQALVEGAFTDPTQWSSYEFRICNLMNPNNNLDDLPGMRDVAEAIDLYHIGRLSSTEDVIDLAEKVYDIIDEHVSAYTLKNQQQMPRMGQGEGDEGEGDDDDWDDVEIEIEGFDGPNEDGSDGNFDMPRGGAGAGKPKKIIVRPGTGKGNGKELPGKLQKKIQKAFEKQKAFIDGKVEKKKMTKELKNQVENVSDAQAEMKHVDYQSDWSGKRSEKVVVMKNMTRATMESDWFPFASKGYDKEFRGYASEAVTNGIRMGRMLASKLTAHDDVRVTTFTRQRKGRIDKRLLSQLGFEGESVFYNNTVEKYRDSYLHLTIDGSGSMGGTAFNKAIQTSVAIAKAIDEVQNMDCVISIRGTVGGNGYNRADQFPFIVIAYDSRKDPFSKIRSLFPYLQASGTTPEGLTFAAIADLIPEGNNKQNSYFVNMCDGEPYFNGYSGEAARKHTRGEVKKLRDRGVKVVAYFISNGGWGGDSYDNFREMYGEDSHNVDVNNITKIANVLNKKFLENDKN